jgi:hypothetical protein
MLNFRTTVLNETKLSEVEVLAATCSRPIRNIVYVQQKCMELWPARNSTNLPLTPELYLLHPPIHWALPPGCKMTDYQPVYVHCKLTGQFRTPWCIGCQNGKYIFRRRINVFFVNKLISTEKKCGVHRVHTGVLNECLDYAWHAGIPRKCCVHLTWCTHQRIRLATSHL